MFRNSVAQISKRSFTSSGARSYFAKAQFLGRIGADIEESVSANGKRYVRYPIAVQTNKDYPVNWFNIVAFSEKQVDFLTNYVKKGSLVHVDAAITQDSYEREDGSKASNIAFVQSM
ncbi:Single-stranded DNA-binding protein RIM1, mitochondrial AltName: Full=Mitochondrial ssDNA-binding protein; Flags: Precursor [Cyberlindnera jadinii]|uniref:RIM1 protein n=1 Tax=Cyberlindnera jadinii (strain ATCC 18201 / CBS 1600 / BCRC 20928 / JCM 3617 / NBRC 0987 / NRRL Y-1542) TaxID=983966 RepID=A0A0H5C7N6_CYBJN|nr:Single-stranded DNA-binding protein RIM1, mitochondrial AltName: Full=Mitochondrial ssDNA-binding protein; Flags: Precursor [Cyberlindnera jadinii]